MPNPEKKEMTLDQIAEMLNNPVVLQAAVSKAQAAGMLPGQNKNKDEDEEFHIETPEPLELPEDATVQDLAKMINKALQGHSKAILQYVDKRHTVAQKQTAKEKMAAEAEKIRAFAQDPKNKHFHDPKVFAEVDKLFRAGNNIEDAYKKALKLLDIKDESPKKASEGSNKDKETPQDRTVNPTNDDGHSADDLTKIETFKSTEDASKDALKKELENNPEARKLIEGDSL